MILIMKYNDIKELSILPWSQLVGIKKWNKMICGCVVGHIVEVLHNDGCVMRFYFTHVAPRAILFR
jgi:hypothetical protein